jgi:Flp pilus assembly protein TadG
MRPTAFHATRRSHRRGTATVEVAMVLPVFFTFIFGIIEFGRLQMVSNLLRSACRQGARLGATENVSSADTQSYVLSVLAAGFDTSSADASVYDTEGPYPDTAAELNALTDIELNDAEPRHLFLVRATVPYNSVALIPFPGLSGVTLSGQAFSRHE